jgi:hypothetical protein
MLYSPECFTSGQVEWDFDSMVNNPCYDVLSDASGSTYWVEYIGCPQVSEQNSASQEFFPRPIGADQEENLAESIAKGCAPSDLFEDLSCKGPKAGYPYRPVTQQGTLAPIDWRSHVVPLKRASSYKPAEAASKPSSTAKATTSTLSTTNPYVLHRDGDTGRSQGQVVSESKRAAAHAAATKVQAKLAATEKAMKAQGKKK